MTRNESSETTNMPLDEVFVSGNNDQYKELKKHEKYLTDKGVKVVYDEVTVSKIIDTQQLEETVDEQRRKLTSPKPVAVLNSAVQPVIKKGETGRIGGVVYSDKGNVRERLRRKLEEKSR
jgi:hypothetical protein